MVVAGRSAPAASPNPDRRSATVIRDKRDALSLAAALALPLTAGGIGGVATAKSVGTWYRTLDKPPWTPPNWLFGPAWTVLYVLMGVASWLVWRSRDQRAPRALRLYGLQLALNTAWSLLFFGARRLDLALAEVAALWAAILATTISFFRIRPVAGVLMLAYQGWTTFAAALNASVWQRNR
jgi:translocator protein